MSNYWGVFNLQRNAYFGNMDGSTQRTLQAIQDVFLELDAFTKDFNDLKEVCRNFADEVSFIAMWNSWMD